MGTMLHNEQRPLAELGDFLAALRVSGVPVGPADIDRLRQLFALEPRLDRDRLKSMLSALLVKTPAQREVFEALFASWCPDHAADWPEEDARDLHAEWSASYTPQTPLAPQEPPQETTPKQPRHGMARRLLTAVLVLVLSAGLLWLLWPPNIVVQEPRLDPISLPARLSTDDSGPQDLPATPVDKVWIWQAEVNSDHVHVPWRLTLLELALLGLVAL
jgi:hypothetical protein